VKPRLDSTRSGSRDYTPTELRQVKDALLKRVGREYLTTIADLSLHIHIDGRTIRSCISDLDGVAFLVGGGSEGVYVCAFADEGDDMTRRMESTAASMMSRVERRKAFAGTLERRQERLFGF
jgi:hypothetical protein